MMRSRPYLFVFRGRLLRAAGCAALSMPLLYGSACGGEAIVNDGGQGGSTNGSTSSNTTNGQSVTNGSTGNVTVGVGGGPSSSSSSVGQGGGHMVTTACWSPPLMSPCPSVGDAGDVYGVCTPDGYWIEQWLSGPNIDNGMCCYELVASSEFCGVGRPLMLEDRAVTARARVGEATSGCDLERSVREALAEAWTRDGLFEHASVASFARVALELAAVGAPAELVAAAHCAALDEIEHARLCFALASRFGGRAVSAGPLELPRALVLRTELVEVALSAFVEGCIGETLSAALAREQAERATDPEVRAALMTIAEDETRHAELAWRTVAWAVRRGGPEVREAIGRALVDARRHAPPVTAPSDEALAAYGRPSAAVVHEVQRRTLVDVVLPCTRALLADVPPAVSLTA